MTYANGIHTSGDCDGVTGLPLIGTLAPDAFGNFRAASLYDHGQDYHFRGATTGSADGAFIQSCTGQERRYGALANQLGQLGYFTDDNTYTQSSSSPVQEPAVETCHASGIFVDAPTLTIPQGTRHEACRAVATPPLCTQAIFLVTQNQAVSANVDIPIVPARFANRTELQQREYTSGISIRAIDEYVTYERWPSLQRLVNRELDLVPDMADRVFPKYPVAQKVTFVYQFVGLDGMHKRQVNVLRMKDGVSQQPTKGDLAVHAAKEMDKYIDKLKGSNITFPYDLDQLVLLYIVRTSKGSVQAHIGLARG